MIGLVKQACAGRGGIVNCIIPSRKVSVLMLCRHWHAFIVRPISKVDGDVDNCDSTRVSAVIYIKSSLGKEREREKKKRALRSTRWVPPETTLWISKILKAKITDERIMNGTQSF